MTSQQEDISSRLSALALMDVPEFSALHVLISSFDPKPDQQQNTELPLTHDKLLHNQWEPVGEEPLPMLNDALSYLDAIKLEYADKPEVYETFLNTMSDFKNGRIDTPKVIERICQLFQGNMQILYGFHIFLPPNYKSNFYHRIVSGYLQTPAGFTNIPNQSTELEPPKAPSEDHKVEIPRRPTEYGMAIEFVKKVGSRFPDQPGTFKEFLEILKRYQCESLSLEDVRVLVAALFKSDSDLMEEFDQFLPPTTVKR